MKINFERVAELLQSDEFKRKIRVFAFLDMEEMKRTGKTHGISIAFLICSICAEIPFEKIKGPLFPVEEMTDFLRANREYVETLMAKILGESSPLLDNAKKGG